MRGIGIIVVAVLATTACKVAEGDRCVCADDCRSGLVCAVSGEVLEGDSCSPGGASESGYCLPEDDIPEGQDPLEQPDVFFADLAGSRRDFEPDPPDPDDEGDEATGTDSGSTDSAGTDSTDTGTTGGTDSTDTDSTGGETTGTTSGSDTGVSDLGRS